MFWKQERYLAYYIPFIAFHGNWNKLKAGSLVKNSDHMDFYESMGYWRYKDETYQVRIDDYRTYEQEDLSEEVIETLDEIVRVCRENNIEIIFLQCHMRENIHISELWKNTLKIMAAPI